MEFLTKIEQDGKNYSIRDLAAHVMIDSTRLDLKNFKRNSNIKLDSLEKLFNSFKSYAVCTKTDAGVPDVDDPSKSVIYLAKITEEGEEDPKYEMWIYDVTNTWQNLGISTTNLEGFIKTDDLGSELYYGTDDNKLHINVDNSTIKLNTAGKLSAVIEANPTDTATKKISSIKIGNTVYDNLPEAGTAISYSTNQVTPHDFETKVEKYINSTDTVEVACINGKYTFDNSDPKYDPEMVSFNVILPNNPGSYEKIISTFTDSLGREITVDFNTLGDWAMIYFDETDPDRDLKPMIILNARGESSLNIMIGNVDSVDDYTITCTQFSCNHETSTDGKKINVSIDDDSIKVSDDNKLYANLEPIETAIGKDEDDNLIKVADNIKDNAVNATYGTYYDYGTSIITEQTISQPTINWPDTYEEIGLWIDVNDDGNYVYYGAFCKENDNVLFKSSEVDGNKTYVGLVDARGEEIWINTEWTVGLGTLYYFWYNIAGKYLYINNTSSLKTMKLTQQNFVTTTIKGKIDSVEDSIVNVEANPTEEATEDLSKIKIGDTVYSVGSSEGPSKIYDSATDTTYHGNLWETTDGSITVGSSEDGYNDLEIYYSSKNSGQIQYYKINTEMITSPKTDKGMFYVLVPGSNGSAFDFEQIEVSIVTDTEGKKSVKLASKSGTDSIVKIERVYNVQPGNGGFGGGGGTGSGVAPAEAPTEEGTYLVEAKLVAGEMTLTYKPVTDLDGETY